jgi:uncharacterized protein
LTSANLEKLDAYLSSDQSPDNCMQLSDLDGFLTGIICSPVMIPPSDWLPVISNRYEPSIKNVITTTWVIQEIFARNNEIASCLNSEPAYLEPIFWTAMEGHVIAMDWCEGFMDAYELQSELWHDLMVTDLGMEWMHPIMAHLFDEDGQSMVGARETEIDALLERSATKIADTVPKIFTYWQSKQSQLN